jgi:hypothetical protein
MNSRAAELKNQTITGPSLKGDEMPVAVRSTEVERYDLKTLDGAFVVLRRMSYGQILERRALMKLTFQTQGKSKNVEGEIAMANKKVNLYEFLHCVVEHNLERVEGQLLNLTNPVDVDSLDPKVGQEIERLIEKLNNFEDEDAGDEDPGNSSSE